MPQIVKKHAWEIFCAAVTIALSAAGFIYTSGMNDAFAQRDSQAIEKRVSAVEVRQDKFDGKFQNMQNSLSHMEGMLDFLVKSTKRGQ